MRRLPGSIACDDMHGHGARGAHHRRLAVVRAATTRSDARPRGRGLAIVAIALLVACASPGRTPSDASDAAPPPSDHADPPVDALDEPATDAPIALDAAVDGADALDASADALDAFDATLEAAPDAVDAVDVATTCPPPDFDAAAWDGPVPDFASGVQPIFTAHCGCHQSGGLEPFLDPGHAYATLVCAHAVPGCPGAIFRVVPGDPASSAMYRRITGASCYDPMPLGGPYLADPELARVRDWILAGAPP